MKKLLFVVAIATIGLTTSCTKDCSVCSLKSGSGLASGNGKTVEDCKALKAIADQSSGNATYSCD
jgi:hypothetical protein